MERERHRTQTYKRHKYDGTKTTEGSDIQKTPNTHTKYMIEGKTTKSTYTKRRQIRWNETYSKYRHTKRCQVRWNENYS